MLSLLLVSSSLAGPSRPPVVVCSPPKPTVVRSDPKLDATSLGVLDRSTCGLLVRTAADGGTAIQRDAWVYVERPGGLAGWAFVSGADANAWTLDESVPEMRALATSRALEVSRSAAMSDMLGILTANLAHDAAWDRFLSSPTCPVGAPGREPRPWTGECAKAWSALGWMPDGPVACSYASFAAGSDRLLVYALCDADQDGVQAVYVLDHPSSREPVSLTPPGVW